MCQALAHDGQSELEKESKSGIWVRHKIVGDLVLDNIIVLIILVWLGRVIGCLFPGESLQGEDQEERGQARQVGGQVRAGQLEPVEGGGRVAQDPRQLLPRQAAPPHGPRDQPQLRRLPRYRLRHLHLLPGKGDSPTHFLSKGSG